MSVTQLRTGKAADPIASSTRANSSTRNELKPAKTHFEARLKAVDNEEPLTGLRALIAQPRFDYSLVLVTTTLLVSVGCLMVLSSSSVWSSVHVGDTYYFIIRQLMFLVIGAPAAFVLSRLNGETLKIVGWLAMIVTTFLLLLVFTPLGEENYGNRSWLRIGPIGLQPSELAKFALVVWSAAVLSNRTRTLDQTRRLLVPVLPGFMVILLLVLAQRDLGTALIIGVIMFAVLWFVGTPLRILAGLGAVGFAGVATLIVTNPERMKRIFSFLGHSDIVGASDQPVNAIYALASGGWWGVGLGGSRQKWGGLYNGAQTDYVFAVLGEELGLVGTLAVIMLFAGLIYGGCRIALRSTDPFFRYASAAITAWIGLQAVLNIAVVMRLLPVFGVPLPFLSQGGSALVSNLMAVGVLLAAARNEPAMRAELAAKKKPVSARPRLTSVVDSAASHR